MMAYYGNSGIFLGVLEKKRPKTKKKPQKICKFNRKNLILQRT
jgi:hypothetical protein